MPSGSGLDAQFGFKLETTYGTPVTVDRFVDFDSESVLWVPTYREPTGLRPGRRFKRASRLARTREGVAGQFTVQHGTRDMGTLWKWALASAVTTPTVIVAPAYRQVHQPGQSVFPPSMTLQFGRPEPESGTVRAHTIAGAVCTGWQFSVSDNDTAQMQFTADGRSEATATALAAAAYTAGSEVFDFSDASVFKTGGTPSTSSGVVSIASGVQVPTVVRAFTLAGSNPAAAERYGLGNAGLKNAPRYNDVAAYTGTLTAEYDRSTWYDPFKANTSIAMQLSLIGSAVGASFNTLDFVVPVLKIKSAGAPVGGPDIVAQSVEFEIYDDDVNAPFQATIISADLTAL